MIKNPIRNAFLACALATTIGGNIHDLSAQTTPARNRARFGKFTTPSHPVRDLNVREDSMCFYAERLAGRMADQACQKNIDPGNMVVLVMNPPENEDMQLPIDLFYTYLTQALKIRYKELGIYHGVPDDSSTIRKEPLRPPLKAWQDLSHKLIARDAGRGFFTSILRDAANMLNVTYNKGGIPLDSNSRYNIGQDLTPAMLNYPAVSPVAQAIEKTPKILSVRNEKTNITSDLGFFASNLYDAESIAQFQDNINGPVLAVVGNIRLNTPYPSTADMLRDRGKDVFFLNMFKPKRTDAPSKPPGNADRGLKISPEVFFKAPSPKSEPCIHGLDNVHLKLKHRYDSEHPRSHYTNSRIALLLRENDDARPLQDPSVVSDKDLDFLHMRHQTGLLSTDIAQKVSKKKIDPANLVVIVGKDKNHQTSGIFSAYLIQSMAAKFKSLAVCQDINHRDQNKLHPSHPITWSELPEAAAADTNYSLATMLIPCAAAATGASYHAVGIGVGSTQQKITENPSDAALTYPPRSFVGDHIKRHPIYCSVANRKQNLASDTGRMASCLFAANRVDKIQKETKGPIILFTDLENVVDLDPTLVDMLTTNNKDVMTVNLHGGFNPDFAETNTLSFDHLTPEQKQHFHGTHCLIYEPWFDAKSARDTTFLKNVVEFNERHIVQKSQTRHAPQKKEKSFLQKAWRKVERFF